MATLLDYAGGNMINEDIDKNAKKSVLDDLINETANKEVEYIENKEGGNLKEKDDSVNNGKEATPSKSTPTIEPEENAL